MPDKFIRIADHISRALHSDGSVVALESTVIAHGLPFPVNVEAAQACEDAVRQAGAVPATIGIAGGLLTVGLSEEEIDCFARGRSPDGDRIEKVGLNNMAAVMARRGWGATTVAGTMRIASLGGIKVFSTGGIGGVHRGAAETFDISADLTALATTQMVCVSAGAKAILDLPKTVEYLETLGVPVIGYGTDEFPAFYSRKSGIPVDVSVDTPDEVAEIFARHSLMGGAAAVLVCVPIPEEYEIPLPEVERATVEAMEMAARQGIRGKAITPFLLARMQELTGGDSLYANYALLVNNAGVAARIAVSLARLLPR